MDNLQDTPSTSAIDDLVTDVMGGESPAPSQEAASTPSEPATTESQAAPVSTEQEPVQSQETGATEPTTPQTEQPTPQSYRIGDREYTVQELQAALTSAQQLPNLQHKYVGVLEQLKQGQQASQQPQGSQPQTSPQQVMNQLRAKYDAEVKDLASKGLIEQDFATLFPGMAAQMLNYRDGFHQLAQVVQSVAGQFQANQQREQSTGLINEVGQSINALANSGEAFAPLKDPQNVQRFFNYLWELNPQVGHLRNPQFLASQWVAYNKDQYLSNAQAQAQATQRANEVRLARADATTATRPGFSQPSQKTPLDELVEDFLQRGI